MECLHNRQYASKRQVLIAGRVARPRLKYSEESNEIPKWLMRAAPTVVCPWKVRADNNSRTAGVLDAHRSEESDGPLRFNPTDGLSKPDFNSLLQDWPVPDLFHLVDGASG